MNPFLRVKHTFMCRPRLKGWCVTRHTRKVAIMQPIQNLLFLTYTRIPESIFAILAASMPSRSLKPRIVALAIIRLLPPTANEQHITYFDVTTLCGRSNVDTLIFAALVQFFPGDGIVIERIIIDALFLRIASVVEQNATTSNTVFCPVVDGALVICGGANNICAFGLEIPLEPCCSMNTRSQILASLTPL